MGLPLVSVYLPTHNRGSRLMRAVQSVISQDYQDVELCIVDDGSSDSTWELCLKLQKAYKNIKVARHPTPLGACAARNRAIAMAEGVFVTGLDDDDEFTSDRIRKFVEAWDEKYSFLCANFLNCTNGVESLHFARGGSFSFKALKLNNEAGNQVFTLLNRIVTVGGFDRSVRKLQDWDLWLRLSNKYGGLKRLDHTSYKMHHEGGDRVSNNESYACALKSMIARNRKLYSSEEAYLLDRYLVERRAFPNFVRELKLLFDPEYAGFILRKAIRNALGE